MFARVVVVVLEIDGWPKVLAALVAERTPSAWEVQRAQLAERMVALLDSEEKSAALWRELLARPPAAQNLVDALLQRCCDEILAQSDDSSTSSAGSFDSLLDPGLAVKVMMQPIPIGLRARNASVEPFPDSGGACVEPLTKMSRLSDFVWERIDAAALKGKAGEGERNSELDDNELEDEISGMDENEFREYMASRLSDLGGMDPEQRAAQLLRLKRAISSFAASARHVPQVS